MPKWPSSWTSLPATGSFSRFLADVGNDNSLFSKKELQVGNFQTQILL
jgi:hypothetical protein